MSTPPSRRPHLIMVLLDDLGYFNVGQRNPEMRTPVYDHLATVEGATLARHYTHPFCSPTRSSFLSGRLPIHVKVDNDWIGGVPLAMRTLPQKLKDAGYGGYGGFKDTCPQPQARYLAHPCLFFPPLPHDLLCRSTVSCGEMARWRCIMVCYKCVSSPVPLATIKFQPNHLIVTQFVCQYICVYVI